MVGHIIFDTLDLDHHLLTQDVIQDVRKRLALSILHGALSGTFDGDVAEVLAENTN